MSSLVCVATLRYGDLMAIAMWESEMDTDELLIASICEDCMIGRESVSVTSDFPFPFKVPRVGLTH